MGSNLQKDIQRTVASMADLIQRGGYPPARRVGVSLAVLSRFRRELGAARSTSRSIEAISVTVIAVAMAVSGCGQPDIATMSAADKAKRTTELRLEANECYQRFTKSNFDDIEALECYIEKARQTTELHPAPSSCPTCYSIYGFGLHLLGIHYWEKRKEAEAALELAEGAEADRLRRAVADADAKLEEQFRKAADVIEAYISGVSGQGGVSVDPRAYEYLSQEYAELGDFRRAIRALTFLEKSRELADKDRTEIARRISSYRILLERNEKAKLLNRIDIDG
jgi:hypothetical protein